MFSDFSEHRLMHHDDFRRAKGKFDVCADLELKSRRSIEGWAAAAAVAVGVGASAYSAYSSSSAKQDALDYQSSHTPKLQSYKPVLANYDPNAGISQYLNAQNQYGGQAAQAAATENKYYQDSINALAPVTANLAIAGQNATREVRGQLPKDLASLTARNAAQANLTSGLGYNSGQGQNRVARDYGLTTLDLQHQGLADLSTIQGLAQKLTPVSGAQLIGDPSQYSNRADRFNLYNNDVQNQALKDAAGVQNQNQVNQYQAGLAGVEASSINPYASAGVSALGSISSYYTGGAAGGYGFGGQGANAQGFYGSANAASNAYGQGSKIAYSPGAGGPNGGGGYYAYGNSGWGGG